MTMTLSGQAVLDRSTPSTLAPPTEADFDAAAKPILLRTTHPARTSSNSGELKVPRQVPINTGQPSEFETELFKGWVCFWASGTAGAGKGPLVPGKKRRSSLTVQGRFKEAVPYGDLWTGQSFARPLKGLPPKWLQMLLAMAARKINPSLIIGPPHAPSILTAVLATSQAIQVSRLGEAPAPGATPVEDLSLLGGKAPKNRKGMPMSPQERCKYFAAAGNCAGRAFDTSLVWTFHFWQHRLDLGALELELAMMRFRLARLLDGQPLQLNACTRAGRAAWQLELWHEQMLQQAPK